MMVPDEPLDLLEDRGAWHQVVVSHLPCAAADADGEIVLLDDNGRVHVLNSTAAAVWRLTTEPCSVAELLLKLREIYEDEHRTMPEELVQLLAKLRELGLLSILRTS